MTVRAATRATLNPLEPAALIKRPPPTHAHTPGRLDVVGLWLGREPTLVVHVDIGSDAAPWLVLRLQVPLTELTHTDQPPVYVIDLTG